jgi:hypothetical protein
MKYSWHNRKYEVSETRKKEFEQLPGEDTYQWIARQLTMATPFEGAWLMMLRSDEKQRHVFELIQLAKSERAARRSMWALYLTLTVAMFAAFAK